MGDRLAGKVAVVTGGAGGIGEETVRLFVREGAQVMIVDIHQEASQRVAHAIDPTGENVAYTLARLDREEEAKAAIESAVSRFGKLDILANVAAVRVRGTIPESTMEDWNFILGANLLAVSHCCKYAIPKMVENGGGSIITVSSANATVGRKGMGLYDATKAAVLALTRSMACDHAEQNIRVNAISPGPTLTKFHINNRSRATGKSVAEAEAEMRAAGAPHTLMNRMGEPVEQAYAILWLASDEASYVTGADFNIDGGIMGLRD
jgi:NAD(P)-dependent dehydrogenase (short-subunit alcohol dehydrogenase family)